MKCPECVKNNKGFSPEMILKGKINHYDVIVDSYNEGEMHDELWQCPICKNIEIKEWNEK